jgi:signal peptidase I
MAKKSRKKNRERQFGRAARESTGSGSADDTKKRDAKGKEQGGFLELLKSLVIAAALFLFLRAFVLQTFVITSGSMEDTLLVGDFLMVNRVALGSRIPGTRVHVPGFSRPERGDVLVFDPHHDPDLKLVKRLIGMAGDTLEMRGGDLFLNGQRQEEPYVRHLGVPDESHPWMTWQPSHLLPEVDRGTYRPTRDNWGPLVIPEGHYFMLGDNRDTSLDSRYWGPLEQWRIEGRAVFKYFSYDRDSLVPFAWLRRIRWNRILRGIH